MSDTDRDVNWLHISDCHFKNSDPYDRDVVLRALMMSLPNLIERHGKPDLIFVSGDIAYSGKPDEYIAATAFFDDLLQETGLTKRDIFIVPGNHDVCRSEGAGLVRSLTSREESDGYFNPQSDIIHISKRQRAFSVWYNNYFENIRTFAENSTCGSIEVAYIRGFKIAVLLLNSAAFSCDDSDHGQLWLGRRCIDAATQSLAEVKADLSLAVVHHPFDWLHHVESANIKALVRRHVDCVLSGHLHVTDIEQVAGLAGSSLHFAAGALYDTRKRPNTAMFASLNNSELLVMPIKYQDSPQECWTVDPGIFPDSPDFTRVYQLPRVALPADSNATVAQELLTPTSSSQSAEISLQGVSALPSAQTPAQLAKVEFEQDLFAAPGGERLYAEPRLMSRAQDPGVFDDEESQQFEIQSILDSSESFIIEVRSEYGGTTLCKRLAYEFAKEGRVLVYKKDARSLGSYRKKLESSFPPEAKKDGSGAVLILDNFDHDRDERLLKELISTSWFERIIVIATNRDMRPGRLIDPDSLSWKFSYLYLWGISRSDVRKMSALLFETGDDIFTSSITSKVYDDLLGLCIPLTPSNVIMYLKILFKEGDFHPLNRVDIVGRYLLETLRRPSDAYSDNFNSKNKLDVVAAFVHSLYKSQQSNFDERQWHDFAKKYQTDTLIEFDASNLLNELIEVRIFVRYNKYIYIKYSFFFSYFVGRYLAFRSALLKEFLEKQEYLSVGGVVEVITGLSSENTLMVEALTNSLEKLQQAFFEMYIKEAFDPLLIAQWPNSESDEERIWLPVSREIEKGPRDVKEIDILKSSLRAEARTTDQQIKYNQFVQLEYSLFSVNSLLCEALKNSDDISGDLKLKALDAIFKSYLIAFQIGTVLAPVISKNRYVKWGGISFFNFHSLADTVNPESPVEKFRIINALCYSVAEIVAGQIGTRKLGSVFRSREKSVEFSGFLEFLNFNCMLSAKPSGWYDTLAASIERTDKNAFYLLCMLRSVMSHLKNEINQNRDRESLKRLVALVQTKRRFGKNSPGEKAIDKMLQHLEKVDHFKSEGNK